MGCIQPKTSQHCGMFVVKPVEVLEDCIKKNHQKSLKKCLISEIEIDKYIQIPNGLDLDVTKRLRYGV